MDIKHLTIQSSTFFLKERGGEVSRTSPQSPKLGSSRWVLVVQEDQVGPSDPAAPRVLLGPADLATLLDPRLPARHVKTPQEMKTLGWSVKMLDQRRSYLRSRRASDARFPLVEVTRTGQTANVGNSNIVFNSFLFLSK